MGILNTLGSLALNNLKKAASKEIAKKIAPKITPAKGSGGVSVEDKTIQNIRSMPPQAIEAGLSTGAITQEQVDRANLKSPTQEPPKPKDISELGNHTADEFVDKEHMTMGGSLMDFSEIKAEQANAAELGQWAKQQKQSTLFRNPEALILDRNVKKNIGYQATLALALGQDDKYAELKHIKERGLFQSFVDKDTGDGVTSGDGVPSIDEIIKNLNKSSYQKMIDNKTQAISEVDKFNKVVAEYKTPQNRIETKTKEVLGAKYDEVRKHVDDATMYLNAVRSSDDLKKDIPTFARYMWGRDTFRGLGDLLTDGQLSAGNEALDILDEMGETNENKFSKFAGKFIGGAPPFLVSSYFGATVLPESMVALGGYMGAPKVGQAGLKLLQVKATHPLVYEAVFDNAYGIATGYAMSKAYGEEYSPEQIAVDGFLGVITPKVFDFAGDIVGKGVKMFSNKNLDLLESALKEGEISGDKRLSTAIAKVSETSNEFNDEITNSMKGVDITRVPTVRAIDVQLAYANEKISLSNLASKRLAKFTNDINELVSKDKVAPADGAQIIAEVRANILQKQYHNKTTLDDIIGGVEKKYGKTFSKFNEKLSANDSISELLHTESASAEKLANAKTSDEVVEAFTGNKPTSIKDIDDARVAIDDLSRGGVKAVEALAEKHGITVDWGKAVDKFGQANKEYLHKVLDSVESAALGYNKFAQRSLAKVRETFSSIKKNLTSASRFDAIGIGKEALSNIKTLNDEVGLLTQRLRTATDAKVKLKVAETIAKKNEQIAKLKDKNAIRIKEQRALISMIKDDIDTMASDVSFSHINPVTLRALKNEAKAKLLGKTTVEQAEEIVNSLNEKLFKIGKKDILKKIDKTLDSAKNNITKKGGKSIISPEYVRKMIDLNEIMNRDTSSITDLQILHNQLKVFQKEGRDIVKENTEIFKRDIDLAFTQYSSKVTKRLTTTGYNSPVGGTGRKPTMFEKVRTFFRVNTQSHHHISSIVGEGTIAEKVLNTDLLRADSIFESKKIRAEGILGNMIDSAIKGVKQEGDSTRHELSLWLRRESGADANFWNIMWFKKENGTYRFIPVVDSGKLPDDVIEFQSLTNDEKNSILSSIYSKYDKLFDTNDTFRKSVTDLANHFDETGLSIKDKRERIVGKAFDALEHYFPIIHKDKIHATEVIGDDGKMVGDYYSNMLNTSFTKGRTPITSPVNVETDIATVMQYHLNTAVYWDNMVEPMMRARAFLNRLKGGNVDSSFIDGDAAINMGMNVNKGGYTFDSSKISREAIRDIEIHLEKVATRGASIRLSSAKVVSQILSEGQQWAVPIVLGNAKTIAKQGLSHVDILTELMAEDPEIWKKALVDGLNLRKIGNAMDESGLLMARMPNLFTNEGELVSQISSSQLTLGQRFSRGVKTVSDNTFMVPLKFVDGNASATALQAGVRKWIKQNSDMLADTGRLELVKNADGDVGLLKKILNGKEFNDMMGEGEVFMSRIMGSNSVVSQGIGSQETLSKTMFFLQKTGLNRIATIYGRGLKKVFGKNVTMRRRVTAFTSMAVNSALSFGITCAIDEAYEKIKEILGIKTPSKDKFYYLLGMKFKQGDEIFGSAILGDVGYWGSKMYDSLFISPSLTVGVGEGIPVVDDVKKVLKAPTTGRKAEEFGYAITSSLFKIPSNYMDGARLLGSQILRDMGGRGITKVDNAKYDEMANELIKFAKEHGDTKIEDMEQAMKDYAPIKEAKTKLAEERKVVSDNKDKVTKELLKKYGNDITQQEFYEYAKNNLDTLRSIGITDKNKAKAYYSTLMVEGGRSEGERASYLMSQPIEVIYNSTLKQHIINDDEEGFKKELQYLLDKKVIKDKNGLEKLMQMVEMEGK